MANTFTTMTHTILAQRIMEAFVVKLAPIRAFASNFSAEAVQRGDKIKVPFVSAADAAADFSGSYTMQGVTAEGKEITIDKRKYVSWALTGEEISTMPQLTMDMFVNQKANALAKAVLADIWSLVTTTNYGSTSWTAGSTAFGTAMDYMISSIANFDTTELAQLMFQAGVDEWPDSPRSLILPSGYIAALASDSDIVGTLGLSGNNALITGKVPKVYGFDIYECNQVPTNSRNLVGFACHPDAMLIAMRAIIPEEGVALRPQVEVLTDEGSGVTLVMREWFDADNDRTCRVLECNYGYLLGNDDALFAIQSS
jgi:hypothetical protein